MSEQHDDATAALDAAAEIPTAAKKKRRARGEGGIRWSEPRKLWIVTVPRRGMSPATFCSRLQSEAIRKRDQYLLDVKTGRLDESGKASRLVHDDVPLPRNPTVKEWLDYWLEYEVKPQYDEQGERQTGRQPTTYASYSYIAEAYIYTHSIAQVKLDHLRVLHVERWFRGLRSDRKLSAMSCHRILIVFRAAITRAIKRHDVTSLVLNPASTFSLDVRTPHARKKLPPEAAKVRALYEAARGDRLELVVHLGLRLGLRKQEIAGLRFGDFDLVGGRLRIARRLSRIRFEGVMERGGAKMVDEAEEQEVPLSNLPRWTRLLDEHKHKIALFAAASGKAWQGPEPTATWSYLFPNRKGEPMDPNAIYRWFKTIAVRAGQPEKTLHELRHDCASLAIASGMSLWEVSKLMRHATTQVTEATYGHITGAHESRLYNQVDRALDAMLDGEQRSEQQEEKEEALP